MGTPVLLKRGYRFGLFQIDPDTGRLLRQGVPVRLHEQSLRVLGLLLERAGDIVTREELRQSLWPDGTYVEFEGSLNAILKRLRFALGDDADNPVFIETVPRRGYRFIAPVEREQPSINETPAKAPGLGPSELQTVAGGALPTSASRTWTSWVIGWAAGLALLGLFAWRLAPKRPSSPPNPPVARKVIAVLPFSNEGAGSDFDYLRYAIANDLVTDLTYGHSINVRPFASTSKYAAQPADPASVGKELRVTHVVTGGFLMDKQNLRVNLELVDVAQNLAVWREEITVSPQDLVALHERLAARTAGGLLPAMNVVGTFPDGLPVPKNEQAFELFQHSLSIPLDPESNLLGIKKLEESISLDGSYAPAWGELGGRYSVDFHYGSGRGESVAKSLQAFRRQSELDPNAAPVWTITRVEQGDLNGAYDQVARFLHQHPDSRLAHYEMSYVLRYAGLLDEAGRECDAALALDPGYFGLRSCAVPFILRGDYAHAQRYISLDEKGFGALMGVRIALRNRDGAAALAGYDTAVRFGYLGHDNVVRTLLRACLNHVPETELRQAVAPVETEPIAAHDPELFYQNAELLAFCGQGDGALRLLAKAIRGGHCSYPSMDNDPSFDPIRQRPEFGALRQAGVQCQEQFLVHRQQADGALAVSQF